MAITKLSKRITRESTHVADDRQILVSLLESQEIELRLKGLKTGSVKISVSELWEILNNTQKQNSSRSTCFPTVNDNVSLEDLRSWLCVESGFDYQTICIIERVFKTAKKFQLI